MDTETLAAAVAERIELIGGLNALAAGVGKDYGVISESGKHTVKINLGYGSALITLNWSDKPMHISDNERLPGWPPEPKMEIIVDSPPLGWHL